MDIKDIKTLIKLISDTDISEFEMETDEDRVFIKRGSEPEIIHVAAPAPAPAVAQAAPVTPQVAPEGSAPPAEAVLGDKQERVASPIVGTFYAAPSPESDPYVKVGDVVDSGQTLCIVEAMKLMNEIEAEFKCKIVEIVKTNAEPVEYGDVLFIVERI
ncbi:MAG: acetyl-CoA carboxylase biotin carboxyl carrier protein [Desulfuromonadaceae bacterium]|nr:acetyl-CoA carboxylase biotin carboxyl carrier protein [Desulfuromonadaceae bacterium]